MRNLAFLMVGVAASVAAAGEPFFIVPDGVNFEWTRSASSLSTYAEWDLFTSPFGENAPDVGVFAGSTLDENAGDLDVSDASGGAFITAFGNIYNIFGALDITVSIPNFGLMEGFETTVVVQLRTQGTEVDLNTVLLDGIAPDSMEEGNVIDLGPPMVGGGGRQVDHRFVWTLDGNEPAYELRFTAVEGSLSLDRVIVDTYTLVGAPPSCNAADFAEPFNRLDIADVVGFLGAFGQEDVSADLAAPFGRFDIADVVAFLTLFGQGCPQ